MRRKRRILGDRRAHLSRNEVGPGTDLLPCGPADDVQGDMDEVMLGLRAAVSHNAIYAFDDGLEAGRIAELRGQRLPPLALDLKVGRIDAGAPRHCRRLVVGAEVARGPASPHLLLRDLRDHELRAACVRTNTRRADHDRQRNAVHRRVLAVQAPNDE